MSAARGVFRRRRAAVPAYATTETALTGPSGASPEAKAKVSRSVEGRIGTLFAGRFRLTGLLGVGGMGVVYAAQDELRKRCVAIKLVRSGANRRRSRGARLRREGRVANRLEHPFLVRGLAAGEFEGEPYVVLEYVSGARTLDELRPDLCLVEKVRIVRDAALALGHAHAHGVVHRDVKPDNVLVDERGCVRIVDFGLATTRESDRITEEGCCLGTPLFMAPETICSGEYSPQVDVWALGVTLYWLLTDRFPFEADTLAELLQQVLTAKAPRLRRFDRAVPRQVERVCLRALERETRRRYLDGAALAVELDLCLAQEWASPQTEARHVPGGGGLPEGRRISLRFRLLLGLAWVVVGALIALTALTVGVAAGLL